MGKKILFMAAAIAVPGGLIALAIAWIGSRPDVQACLLTVWNRVSRSPHAILPNAPSVRVGRVVRVARMPRSERWPFAALPKRRMWGL